MLTNKYTKSLVFWLDNSAWQKRERAKARDIALLKPHLVQFLGSSFLNPVGPLFTYQDMQIPSLLTAATQ